MPGQGKRNARAAKADKRAGSSANSGGHATRTAILGTLAAAGIASALRYASNKRKSGSESPSEAAKQI